MAQQRALCRAVAPLTTGALVGLMLLVTAGACSVEAPSVDAAHRGARGADALQGDSSAGDMSIPSSGDDLRGADGAHPYQSGDTWSQHAPGDTGEAPDPGDGEAFHAPGDAVLPALPAAQLVGLGPTYFGPAADQGEVWVDIRVHDAQALGPSWRLMAATYSYTPQQLRADELPWLLADGSLLRFHGIDYGAETDVLMSDNNPDRWDFRSAATFGINVKHGALWLEDSAGVVVDFVMYETHLNDGDWFSGAAEQSVAHAVSSSLWPGGSPENALQFDDAELQRARLRDGAEHDNSGDAWQLLGGPGSDYYVEARGKHGLELKVALHMAIKGHTELPYRDLKSAFFATDVDPADDTHVIQFYTGVSTRADFNREHVWAKSHGGFSADSQAGYSDLHHIRPTRPDVNSKRWHLDFDEGGAPYSDSGANIVTDISWEPRDAVKGDVARMLFYMATRYEGDDGNMPDLELTEDVPSLLGSDGQPDNYQHMSTPRMGRLSTLLRWHLQDPPDSEERRRNDVIHQEFQHNRNPFIDHPEWVHEIWGGPGWPPQ